MRTKLFLLVSVMVLALALSACGGQAAAPVESRTLSVNGSGTVYLTPDIAYIYIGVHTENPDIARAVANNNTQAQTLVNALKAFGVDDKDIQTSNFSVWASQQYDPETGLSNKTVYMVDNTVYVTVRDLTKLGRLLNTAVGAGANSINSIQFDVADKTAAMIEARQKAVDNAASLADELAGAANITLGEIQTISYSDYTPMPYYGMGGGGATAPNVSVPIQPGQLQISVSVNVTYAIK